MEEGNTGLTEFMQVFTEQDTIDVGGSTGNEEVQIEFTDSVDQGSQLGPTPPKQGREDRSSQETKRNSPSYNPMGRGQYGRGKRFKVRTYDRFGGTQNRIFSSIPATQNVSGGVSGPVDEGGKGGGGGAIRSLGGELPTKDQIKIGGGDNEGRRGVDPLDGVKSTTFRPEDKRMDDREYIVGNFKYPGVSDTPTITSEIPQPMRPGEQIRGDSGSGKKRKRLAARGDLQDIDEKSSNLGGEALSEVRKYAKAVEILQREREENPYIKYAVLVATRKGLQEATYVAKPETNQMIKDHKRMVDSTITRIKRLAPATRFLTREHLFDNTNLTFKLQSEAGAPPPTLTDFLEDGITRNKTIYEKMARTGPEPAGVEDPDWDAKYPDGGGEEEGDLPYTIPTRHVTYKNYDINMENELVKEQLATLILEIAENMNLVNAVEKSLATRHWKSYEEWITLPLRVITEGAVESALSRIKRRVLQKYCLGAGRDEFLNGSEVISDLCASIIKDSTGRNVLAAAVVSKMNSDKIDASSASQTLAKRDDIIIRENLNLNSLAVYLNRFPPAIQRSSRTDFTRTNWATRESSHCSFQALASNLIEGDDEETRILSEGDVSQVLKLFGGGNKNFG